MEKNNNLMKKLTKGAGTELSIFLILVILILGSSFISPYFLTKANFANIGISFSYIGTIAAGLTVVMLMGGIDLSQMSSMAVSVMVLGIMSTNVGVNIWIAVLCAVLSGVVAGLINGFIITKMHVIPMIATIGTQMIFRAIAYISTSGKQIAIDSDLIDTIGFGKLFGFLPVMLVISLIVFAVIGFILKYTILGRQIYSIGSNASASYLSGIKNEKIQMIGYIICGMTSGIAGVLWASQLSASVPTAGAGSEMTPIAAAVIGGVSLNGGKGSIVGTLLGVAVLTILGNIMVLVQIDSYYQMMINGIILILAVYIDIIRNRKG